MFTAASHQRVLTISRSVLPYGYSYKVSHARPG